MVPHARATERQIQGLMNQQTKRLYRCKATTKGINIHKSNTFQLASLMETQNTSDKTMPQFIFAVY